MHLKRLFATALVVTATVLSPGRPAAAGDGGQVVENENIRVTLDVESGGFSVLDKEAGVRWVPVTAVRKRQGRRGELPKISKPSAKLRIDGDLSDWRQATPIVLTADMLADAKTVSGNGDLSAIAYLMWDEQHIYVAGKVIDDQRVFRETTRPVGDLLRWWERDSIEIWLGSRQIGFVINPRRSIAVCNGRKLDGCEIAVREADGLGSTFHMDLIGKQHGKSVAGAGGYVFEVAVPIRHFPLMAGAAKVGQRILFAVGINDADAAGKREGQIYYPRSWAHSVPGTFAECLLADEEGKISPEQARKAASEASGVVHNLAAVGNPEPGFKFDTNVNAGGGRKLPISVTITVPAGGRDVCVTIAAPNDTKIGNVTYPIPLLPEQGETCMALAPYGNGLLLPLRTDIVRRWWGSDMPFFGVTNVEAGWGCACIFDTPDDARISLTTLRGQKNGRMTVGVAWRPSMGKWGYTRKVIYCFRSSGGYVALAKAYRTYALEKGTLVTLREKLKRRPNISKLMGAPDIWGANGLDFCREAKAAGIDRLLVNGSWGVAATEAIKELGYLVSVYDNYEDIMAGRSGRTSDCKIPDDCPLMANGKRMLGWPVHEKDPKTGRTRIDPETKRPFIKQQFYKRSTPFFLPVARRWIPPDQEKNPRNARFLDVTTATSLKEDYDPNHYCTRTIDCGHRQALARYVGDELGLVLGGEHGKWWGVPYFDYWEGMQSGGFYSWPAGHVGMDLPRSRDDIGERYLTYGIGHYYRIPFWELVFGDCVVSYWYWGDSTGHMYDVAPEISYKKDLLNMLYGTLPLYWVNRPFGLNWNKPELQARLLESYRNTCKLHEQTGFDEMLDHRWLTEDRTVQQSSFSSGIVVVVNFGDKPYELEHEGVTYPLSPLGFFAKGPKLLLYRVRRDGRNVTYIKTPDYLFADAAGKTHDFDAVVTSKAITIRSAGRNCLHVLRTSDDEATVLRPGRIVRLWDLRSTHVFLLDDTGRRTKEIPFGRRAKGGIRFEGSGRFEVVCGREHDLPNLAVAETDVTVRPERPKQGDRLTIEATVRNLGRTRAANVPIAFYVESQSPENRIALQRITVGGKKSETVTCDLDTRDLDGPRTILVVADPDSRTSELIETDNTAVRSVTIAPDYSRWHYKLRVEVANSPVEQQDVPVVLAVDFDEQLKRLRGRGTLDVDSIRICERASGGGFGRPVPCQFDAGTDGGKGAQKGEVVWVIPGKLAPGTKRSYWLLFDVVENGRKKGFHGMVWDPATNTASTAGYVAEFRDGCIVRLVNKLGTERARSFLTGLVYSSKQTGWGREEASEVLGMDVLANGPLRAIVRIRKKLREELVYTKTYAFYPTRFDLGFEANKRYGVISRAYYGLEGTFEDPTGNKATVDGSGDAENVGWKCRNPGYYVVYAPGWAHSCVSLSDFDSITYWDGGSWGGIGLNTGQTKGVRMSYVMHPGQEDAAFGRTDRERLTNPPTVRVVP